MFNKLKRFFNKTVLLSILAVMVLLCAAFPDFFVNQAKHTVAYYYVYKGDNFYKKGDLQKAINNYSDALRLYPGHVKARYNLGNIYVAYEDFDSAIMCYEDALKYYPDYINARINLAIMLSEQSLNFDRAIDEYKRAIETNPFRLNIPFIFDNSKSIKLNKAIAYYNLGLAYKSKSLLYPSNSSISYENIELAKESYSNSLKYDYENYDTHFNLALANHLLGNYVPAIEEYCRAMYFDPLRYEAHYNLGILLKQKNLYNESVSELEKANLILSSSGGSYQSAYIFDMYNEVSRSFFMNDSAQYKYILKNLGFDVSQVKLEDKKEDDNTDEKTDVVDEMKSCILCKWVMAEEDNKNKN